MTDVIHISQAPKYWELDDQYAYIGRPGRGQEGKWGNPFVLPAFQNRDIILQKYREWLLRQPEKYLQDMKNELRGKTLVCFCKPKACHGDIIAEYVDSVLE